MSSNDNDPSPKQAAQGRPLRWEDDISKHNHQLSPFEGTIHPGEIPIEQYLRSYAFKKLGISEEEFKEILERDQHLMPSLADREGYNIGADQNYFITGYHDYMLVLKAIAETGIEAKSILDFGCASGRVVRHFVCQGDFDEVWGADINEQHIRFIQDYLPQEIRAIHNSALPYFPIADSSLDVVTAFSVFTHIDTFETSWLAEIYRVLRPGGIAFITLHNDETWDAMWLPEEKDFLLKRLKSTNPDVERYAGQPLPNDRMFFRHSQVGPYRGNTFHSNDYIRRTWSRFFDVIDIKPKCHGRIQSAVILQKPKQ